MLNNFINPQEKLITSFFYIFFIILFILGALFIGKKQKKSLFRIIVVYICIFSTIVTFIILLQSLFMTDLLNFITLKLVTILTPLLFYFVGLGIMIYGIVAIIKRETFVAGIPNLIKGPPAIYFGVIFLIAGLMIVILDLIIIRFAFCASNHFLCQKLIFLDDVFSYLGKTLNFIGKPLLFFKIN